MLNAGWARFSVVVVTAFAGLSAEARADHVLLRGGGDIRGVVLPADPARPDIVLVLTRTSARPLEFKKAQILRIDPESDELSEYLKKRELAGQTSQAQYDLGEWCEQSGLSGPAMIHYQKAVQLDNNLEAAHKKLGHVYHNGKWMTYDERRRAQGLILHKGRWVSPQEKEAMDTKAAFKAEQESWRVRLRQLRQKLLSDDPLRVQQAEKELADIREPAAVAPLVKTFGADPEPIRIRLAQVIAAIPGDESPEMLVRLLLSEPDLTVREATLHELATLKHDQTVTRLIEALKQKDPLVVGRAAWALGVLDAVAAVPKLVPVLVKVEEKWMIDPSAASAGGGGISAGFGSVQGMRSAHVGGAVSGGGVTAGTGGMVGGGSYPVLIGPAVGNGVVAYGATSIPYGSFSGLSTGANPNRPTAQLVTQVYPNEEVLFALQKLTGMDFGYDVDSWRKWVATSFRPERQTPERRVPQP